MPAARERPVDEVRQLMRRADDLARRALAAEAALRESERQRILDGYELIELRERLERAERDRQTVAVSMDPRVIRAQLRLAWRAHQARYPDAPTRFHSAIRAAYQRGIRWALEPDEYAALVVQGCAVCGGSVGNGIGLDRLNHALDYEPGNVRPCCRLCNVDRGRSPL